MVETASNGYWDASVIGSYERGTRQISLERAIALADFYGVPIEELLRTSSQNSNQPSPPDQRMIIDLHAVSALRAMDSEFTEPLAQLCKAISLKRQDWNGSVLSLRSGDLEFFALTRNENLGTVIQGLRNRKLLLTRPDRP